MSNVSVINNGLQEKTNAVLEAVFGASADEVFRVVLDCKNRHGKIYLPLCQSVAGLVNTPVDFPVKIEVRDDKTVIHF